MIDLDISDKMGPHASLQGWRSIFWPYAYLRFLVDCELDFVKLNLFCRRPFHPDQETYYSVFGHQDLSWRIFYSSNTFKLLSKLLLDGDAYWYCENYEDWDLLWDLLLQTFFPSHLTSSSVLKHSVWTLFFKLIVFILSEGRQISIGISLFTLDRSLGGKPHFSFLNRTGIFWIEN